ncbi:hypothetical protein LO763_12025 [Glycomyces sp. A-F 0318]|uniref:hypothetical protein n=1 Tax=Glycomyces amatae TaxID=2881355 RepID=UPI001E441385|nr:hypothetical protein [Glycomyces amatae]MCD0444351.1 hypothetical protein [Glycomyces amatae]
MLDLIRRSSPFQKALLAFAVFAAATGAALALSGAERAAVAVLCCLLGGTAVLQALAGATQHRQSMRYAVKADHRLRELSSRLDHMTRTVDKQFSQLSEELAAANRRVLASVESERYAAAARHHQAAGVRAEDRD